MCRSLLLLPLALQPNVGFGLSNSVLPFFPICHQLSPSSHSQHLKISFYFLFPLVISVYPVFFPPSSFNLSSFFLCSTFVTIIFLLGGVVSPLPNPPTWRTWVSLFVWVITFDLSGRGGPTSSICYCQHSSQDHVTTQATPLHQSMDTFKVEGSLG